jgi:hypothetical protein
MMCGHSIDPAAKNGASRASVAERLANAIIDALRIAIIAAPIVFSLPLIARADPGALSPFGPPSAVSRNIAERIDLIDQATPQSVRRMPPAER